jgi:hypothetical protein
MPSTGNSGMDAQMCQQLAQQATSCCRNPASCTQDDYGFGPPIGQGINGACYGANSANTAAGNANSNAGTLCYQKYMKCANTCSSYGLDSVAQQCRGLQAYVTSYGNQGLYNGSAANSGINCNNMAGAMPQSMNPYDPNNPQNMLNQQQAMNDPYGCQMNPGSAACQNCQLNPGSPTCVAAANAAQRERGKAAFQDASANKADKTANFNVPNPSDGVSANTQFPKVEPVQQKVDPIQNGGGSGFPGADGSNGAAAHQQAKLPPAPSYGAHGAGKGAEIDPNALRSGGYSQQPDNGELQTASLKPGGPGAANGRDPTSSRGLDLKKYLPGGVYDGTRSGGYHTTSSEIAGRFADVWKNVTLRMQEKCKLGVLIGCEHGFPMDAGNAPLQERDLASIRALELAPASQQKPKVANIQPPHK